MGQAASMHRRVTSAVSGKRDRKRAMEILARWGLASVGLSFALVGVLALLAAFGAGGAATDRQGALARVAKTGWGIPLLIVVAIGFAGYAIWRFALAVTGKNVEDGERKGAAKRIGYAARGVFYSGLMIGTIKLLFGSSQSGGSQRKEASKVLSWPGGAWIVGAIGIAFIGAALFNGYRAITRKYLEQLKTWSIPEGRERVVQVIAGFGLFTRMLLFSIIGWFLIQAAVDHDPKKTVGLDGALQKVATQTYGRVLLGIVAIGLLAYALYRAVEARYRKV
jgi:uncharacterized protein DUF1206